MKNKFSWICFIIAGHLLIMWAICGMQNIEVHGAFVMAQGAKTFWEELSANHSWIHGILLICDLVLIGLVFREE